jgi:hypothetical protein
VSVREKVGESVLGCARACVCARICVFMGRQKKEGVGVC